MADEPVTKADLNRLEESLLERIERSETTLLREFRKWAIRIETNLKVDRVEIAALKERVLALEERNETPS